MNVTTKFRTRTMFAFVVLLFITVSGTFAQTVKTVGTGADYTTLKAAFDAINAGAITGEIELQITTNVTETATATLYQSGYNDVSSYSSVKIYPTTANVSISSASAIQLISLNGADNITFDGRINQNGTARDLTINQPYNHYGILVYNNADNLIFNYLKIKVNRLAIWITNYDGIAGNDNITIENNEFSNGHTGYTDAVTVRFQGQSTNINNNAIVRNNLFSNILQKGYQTYGVYFENYTSNYEISGNSFYETSPVIPIHNQVLTYIHAANTISGSTALITNNYMGGSAPQCGGSPFTWVGNPVGTTGNSAFWMVELSNSTGATMNVTNNTIKNFDYTITANSIFRCFKIYSNAGTMNLTGNTIGSTTENNSISYMAKSNDGAFYGIDYSGTGTGIVENNSIGGITCKNENAAYATHFYGITVSGNPIVRNNTIGSSSLAKNIIASSASTSNPQYVYGINSTATGATYSNNIIANLTNGTTCSTSSVAGRIAAINVSSGYVNILQNNIKNLTISNANNASGNTRSISGISYTGTTGAGTITGNTITNLQNSFNGFTGEISGISFAGGSTSSIINNNFINSLITSGTSTAATFFGIKAISGNATYSNNIITLGDNTSNTFYGIYDTGAASQTCNIYHNTIYLGGSPTTGSANSYALYSNASSNTRNFRNNIFWNARSNSGSATGKYYAAYYNYTTATNLTNNYNNYFTSGAGGVLAYYNAADRTTIADLRTAMGQDTKSISIDPVLATAGGLEEEDYVPDYRKLIGISGTGITTDYAGVARKSFPSMGAYEIDLDLPVQVWKNNVMEASYGNLKNAFDYINNGTHKGALEIRITESIEETVSAALYQSGYNSTSDYTSIHIFPTVSGITVSGNLATPMISLNGADNVIIDGRVNATGTDKDMTIVNFSTSGSTGTTTVQFVNDASDNTVKYCTLKGSSTWYSAGGGVVYVGTSTGTTGNDNITIDNCNITNSLDANRPRIAIYCNGSSSALSNDSFTLSNCNIYDFFHRTTQASGSVFSYGIIASYNSSALSIINNSFYETTSFVSSGSAGSYYVMSINNSLNNFNISGNYIGGSAPFCGGTAWTKTGDNTAFFGIYAANSGNYSENYVQNNVIRNVNWTNTSAAQWCGISVGAADAGLLTVRNNTVGSGTGTGSIVLNSGNGSANFYGMYSYGTIRFESNTIGSIITNNQPAYATNTYGIYKHTGNCRYIGNLIGSLSTPNSIHAASTSTDQPQYVMGIYISNSASVLEISNNTIANITNATTSTITSNTGILNGITVYANPPATITGNTVFNLTIANANTNSNQNASLGGIVINNTSNKHIVTDNKIYNLSNTYENFAGYVYGIYFTSADYTYTAPSTIARNFISDLYVTGLSSTNANIVGISIASGNSIYSNNVISLGGNSQTNLYGFYDNNFASQISNIYFNTVSISGAPTNGSNKSYALYSHLNTGTRNYRNNIFSNTRSTSSGVSLHYAAYFNYSTAGTLTLDYNNYFTSGTGGVLGYYSNTDVNSLPIISSKDVNSISQDPEFVNNTGSVAEDYKLAFVKLFGITGTGITTDFGVKTRPSCPTMGAWEYEGLNMWKGNISSNWGNCQNWTVDVPASGEDVTFVAEPQNHAVLDINRVIGSLNNAQSTYRPVLNGKKLTVNGDLNFTNGAQIDASASSSTLEFAGTTSTQHINAGNLYEDKVYNLNVKNPNNVVLSGTMRLLNVLSSTSGVLDASTNDPTLIFGGTTQQSSTGATLLSGSAYNLTIDNSAGALLTGNMLVENTLTLQVGDISTNTNKLTLLGNTVGDGGYISTNASGGTIEYAGTSAQTIRRIKDNTANALLVTNTSTEGATMIGTDNSFGDLNTFNLVTVNNGSVLNVAPGEKLTVNSDLVNNGTFVLQSDNLGTATLLTSGALSSDAGTYKVQQYLTGSNNGTAPDGRFWYMASPVTGATSATFNPASTLNKLWMWNEATHAYTQITDNNSSLVNGKGYVARMGNTGNVEFSSKFLNNGDINLSGLSWTGTTHINRGYNLIGNPYPSYLNWKDVWVDPQTAEIRTTGLPNKMRATIWVRSAGSTLNTYNAIAGEFVTTNPQDGEVADTNIQRIAPMQAFWVETFDPEMTDGTITFTNSMRSHQISPEHRLRAKTAIETDKKLVKLLISDGTNSDETIVLFNSNASDAYDLYDSHKMSQNTIPQLYTRVGTEVLSINCMGAFSNEKIVPLGFNVPANGAYTLKAKEIGSFNPGTQVLLVDNATATITDFTADAEYNFNSDKTDSYNRFTLVFRSPGTITELQQSEQDNIVIFRNGDNKILVICNEEIKFNASVTVYNSVGQALVNKSLSGITTLIDKQLVPGVYIVKVKNGFATQSAKVVIE